ncbi:hypothetical protein SCHPADRAFT_423891 [Schizopora paradoxa]|uniref:DUF6533 domain-containing protein n=1 Tax=Schizopora paradoxa TaxID=27342 RepID=A0A0H2RJY9_9AGAM|nr:hypothetical protein SCHPADRAFT_423891 [Schizopora paradoxa]
MFVYDYILTLPDEIEYIWPWEWRTGKILYVATKYLAFVDAGLFLTFWFNLKLTARGCSQIFNAGTWFLSAGAIIAQWILCMRTYAIWGKSKKILVPLLIIVLGAQIGGIYAANTLTKSLEWSLSPFPTISRCYINVTRENLMFVVYILTIVNESLILTLTIWKGVSQWRSSRSPLIKTLYRDGVLYFFVVFAASLLNLSMTIAAPRINQPLIEFLLPEFQRVMHSVCTSHIILNLRKASAGDSGLGVDGPTGAKAYISTLKFGFGRAMRRKQDTSKTLTNVEGDFDFAGSTTVKTDNWASETYEDTGTYAMTESP